MKYKNKKTLLLVEDEVLIAMGKQQELEKYGFNVITASTGEKAVAISRENPEIDLILMDIELGHGIDGVLTAELILKNREIPVIFISSYSETSIIEKTKKAISYGYVVKNSSITVWDASIKMAFKLFEAHKKISESENKYRTLFERESDAIFIYNPETTNILDANGAASKIYGYNKDELIGLSYLKLNAEVKESVSEIDKILEGDDVNLSPHFHRKKDETVFPVDINCYAITLGGENVMYSVNRDISERIQAIKKQRESDSQLRASKESLAITLQSIGDAVIATDVNGNITRMNKTAENLTGWSLADALNRPLSQVFQIINAETRNTVENPATKVIETGSIIGLANHTVLISRSGKEYQISDSAAPIKDAEGIIRGVILVFSDISEQYKTVEKLKISELRFRTIFDGAPLGITLTDSLTGQFYKANSMFAKIIGRSVKETEHLDWMSITHPDDIQKDLDNQKLLNTEEIPFFQMEKRFLHKDGNIVWVNMTVAPIFVEDKIYPTHICMIENITEQKHMVKILKKNTHKLSKRVKELDYHNKFSQLVQDGKSPLTDTYQKIVDIIPPAWQYPEITCAKLTINNKEFTTLNYEKTEWQQSVDIIVDGEKYGSITVGYLVEKQIVNEDIFLKEERLLLSTICERIGHFIEHKMEEEAARLHSVMMENTTEGVFLIGFDDLLIKWVNGKAARMFGYKQGDLVNKHMDILHRPTEEPSNEARMSIIDILKRTGEWHGEINKIKKDGTCFWGYANISLFNHPEFGKVMVSVQTDITERKKVEIELRKYRENLEKLVKERTLSLENTNALLTKEISERKKVELELRKAKDEAEIANGAKSEFLANMSHDLRTPLNAILGNTQMFLRDKELLEQYVSPIKTIHQSGFHLLSMINDILDLSKIEAGKTESISVCIGFLTFLSEITEVFLLAANQKGLTFNFENNIDPSLYLMVDEKHLRQVLNNLLSNAVKFTESGTVSLRVSQSTERYGKKQDNQEEIVIIFEVQDTGIGITEEKMDSIFEPFFQEKKYGFQNEGTGLGLAISRKLVRLMGTELFAESTLGLGSSFQFKMALSVGKKDKLISKVAEQNIVGYKGKTRKILIADDTKSNLDFLKDLLLSLDFIVECASDGMEALTKIKEFHPDLVLTDIHMPKVTGFEVLRKIRKEPAFDNIIFIAISATLSHWDDCIEAGFTEFLEKPIEYNILYDILYRYLNLEWIYKKPEEIKQETDDSPLIAPPKAELIKLLELEKTGNITGIKKLLTNMEEEDERYIIFIRKIRQFTEMFQTEKIVELINSFLFGGRE